MALVYLLVSFVASLAVSVSVYQSLGSIMLSVAAFGATGTIVLCSVLIAAALRESAESEEVAMFPAE